MATISVTIDGKTYRMACEAGQEDHLSGLAHKLDQYISHLKLNFGEIGDHRLSVMAGIMVMDELAEHQRQIDLLKRQNEDLKQQNAALLEGKTQNNQIAIDALIQAAEQVERFTHSLSEKNNPPLKS